MVRTKADSSGRKAVAAKAPRKALGGGGGGSSSSSVQSPSSSSKASKYAGGNPVCDRPTPDWQKSIVGFCVKRSDSDDSCTMNNVEHSGEDTSASASVSSSVSSSASSSSGSQSQESCSKSSNESSSQIQRNGIIDSDED